MSKNPKLLKEEILLLFRGNRNKRLEEQIKMVYKRCIKYLKRAYKRKMRSISYKKYLDLAFYNYYFGEIAKKENISIEKFFTPGSKSQFFKIKANFTYDFLEHTKKSPAFVEDITDYLERHFETQFVRDNHVKIKKLCNDWRLRLEQVEHVNLENMRQIAEELKSNMKIKLPWTMGEMRNSVQNFRSIINI